MGMDMDGPANDKGLYAIVPVKPQMSINTSDMVTWNPSNDRQVSLNRVGFMSQVSPDGKYVVTTVNTAERSTQSNYYVVNFKRLSLPPGVLSHPRDSGLVQPRDRPPRTFAGRRRSRIRADGWRLEPGRQLPGLCPGGGQGPLPSGRENGVIRQRSG